MELGWPKISGENIVSLVLSTLSKVKVAKENSTNSEVKVASDSNLQKPPLVKNLKIFMIYFNPKRQ